MKMKYFMWLIWTSLALNVLAGGIVLSELLKTGELQPFLFLVVHIICIVWLSQQIDKYRGLS